MLEIPGSSDVLKRTAQLWFGLVFKIMLVKGMGGLLQIHSIFLGGHEVHFKWTKKCILKLNQILHASNKAILN